MRIRFTRFLALTLAIGLAMPLLAQQRGGGFGGRGMSGSMLLTQKSVQEELKLSEEQIKKAETAGKDLFGKFRDDFKAAGEDKDKLAEVRKKMSAESDKLLAEVLKPEQLKRLKQIEIQLGALEALAKEDVQKALKLTDKQVSDVKGLADDLRKDTGEIFKDAGKDKDKQTEARTKAQTLRKEATAKFISGLSDDQKKSYKELVGDEFKGKIEFTGGRRPAKQE